METTTANVAEISVSSSAMGPLFHQLRSTFHHIPSQAKTNNNVDLHYNDYFSEDNHLIGLFTGIATCNYLALFAFALVSKAVDLCIVSISYLREGSPKLEPNVVIVIHF